ncbi:ArsA family ATPase [Salirhabdus salicampi]|uniref:ArsA family ATPase n=1 Tax=Salirhabdus salicampi TaxID=476102 RepID=UPI0020C43237|nr:ArsA family ATPase [Salirhabdus salicampi]MCP8615472.1 ArsA family ATPase [Salirhabdus salicampi]
MTNILEKKIVFVGGKGGVGKSTSAAALAMASAKQDKKTLLVSTDPAHNVGDIFHQDIGGKVKKIQPNLYALEVDPEIETKKYISTVKSNLKDMVKSTMMDEVHRQLDTLTTSPGTEEAAMFDTLVSIILSESKHFDLIVFDTAPTGHTVRLLSLPELMGVWMDGMLERRKKINENYSQLLNDGEPVDDPIFEVLHERRRKFAEVREILLDETKTGFIFVLIPERLPIVETEKAIKLMANHELHIKHLIVNKIIPQNVDGEFMEKRRMQEQDYLKQIDNTFIGQEILKMPLFEEDISSIEKLEVFSERLRSSMISY